MRQLEKSKDMKLDMERLSEHETFLPNGEMNPEVALPKVMDVILKHLKLRNRSRGINQELRFIRSQERSRTAWTNNKTRERRAGGYDKGDGKVAARPQKATRKAAKPVSKQKIKPIAKN